MEKSDIEIRTEIARLLTRRCNNCYSELPSYQVKGEGWNWIDSNVGPFCNDCWKYIVEAFKEKK